MILADYLIVGQHCIIPELLIVNILLPLNRLKLIDTIDIINEDYPESINNTDTGEESFQLQSSNNNYRSMRINFLFINFIDRFLLALNLLITILFHSIIY